MLLNPGRRVVGSNLQVASLASNPLSILHRSLHPSNFQALNGSSGLQFGCAGLQGGLQLCLHLTQLPSKQRRQKLGILGESSLLRRYLRSLMG